MFTEQRVLRVCHSAAAVHDRSDKSGQPKAELRVWPLPQSVPRSLAGAHLDFVTVWVAGDCATVVTLRRDGGGGPQKAVFSCLVFKHQVHTAGGAFVSQWEK